MKLSCNEEANVNDLIDKLITFSRHKGYNYKKVGRDVLEIHAGLSSNLRLVITVKKGRTDIELSGYEKDFIFIAIGFILAIFMFILAVLPIFGLINRYNFMEVVKEEIKIILIAFK